VYLGWAHHAFLTFFAFSRINSVKVGTDGSEDELSLIPKESLFHTCGSGAYRATGKAETGKLQLWIHLKLADRAT